MKKNHYPPRWICIAHIWSHTLFPWKIIILQGVLTKFLFLMKFPHLEKFVNLMKDFKYEHPSTFPCGGGSNLILGMGTENQIFILRTPAAIKVFHQILKKSLFGVKKNHYPPRWICIADRWSSTLFPRETIIFQGVLSKFNFSTKFPYLEKIVNLMKDLKYVPHHHPQHHTPTHPMNPPTTHPTTTYTITHQPTP